jgi:cytochrome bd-type quinol oxidase subunit 2
LILRRKRGEQARSSRRISPWALLLLGLLLSGFITFLTWPTRAAITCEQLPELTALAVCAATLFVFSVRSLALDSSHDSRLILGSATVLAALAFFLSVHFVALYRKPCVAVQQHLHAH